MTPRQTALLIYETLDAASRTRPLTEEESRRLGKAINVLDRDRQVLCRECDTPLSADNRSTTGLCRSCRGKGRIDAIRPPSRLTDAEKAAMREERNAPCPCCQSMVPLKQIAHKYAVSLTTVSQVSNYGGRK